MTRSSARQEALEALASGTTAVTVPASFLLELLDELARHERLEILQERAAGEMLEKRWKAVRR